MVYSLNVSLFALSEATSGPVGDSNTDLLTTMRVVWEACAVLYREMIEHKERAEVAQLWCAD